VRTTCDPCDLERTASAVDAARAVGGADAVLVTLHCHEGQRSGWNTETPAEFAGQAARAWIDAGADAVIGHGPHCVRGVELYRGCPIVYSLGNFAFQLNGMQSVPAESYLAMGLDPVGARIDDYRTAVFARPDGTPAGFYADRRFWDGVLADLVVDDTGVRLTLRPVAVGDGRRSDVVEQPVLASGERGRAVLTRVAELSEPWGTRLDIAADGTYATVG
jgi:poly-gamma-glutamate synthesis protein (capsule biosynthesis protein)